MSRSKKRGATPGQATRRGLFREWWIWGVPALAVFVPGLITLRFEFTYDDLWAIQNASSLLKNSPIEDFFFGGRGLKILSFALDEWISGGRPWFYHLHSLLWASLNAALVALIALRISRSRVAALSAGLLFAVHSVHVETVANIANRKDLIAFAFGVGAVLMVLRPVRAGRPPGAGRVAGALALLLVSAQSKEVVTASVMGAMVVCGVMAAWHWFPDERRRPMLRAIVAIALVTAIFTIALVAVFVPDPLELYSPANLRSHSGDRIETPAAWIIHSFAGLFRSLTLTVLPIRLSADHPLPPGGLPGIILGVLGILLLGTATCLGLLLGRRQPMLAFGLCWLAPTLAPVMNLAPFSIFFVAERYLYLPTLGIALVGAGLLQLLQHRVSTRTLGRAAWGAGIGVLVGSGLALSLARYPIWRNEHSLWSHTLVDSPGSFRAHNNLAQALLLDGEPSRAEHHYRMALERVPRHARVTVLCDLGAARLQLSRHEAAEQVLREALASEKADGSCRFNLGVALLKQGRQTEAAEEMEAAIRERDNLPSMHVNLIRFYQKLGRACDGSSSCRRLEELGAPLKRVPDVLDYCEVARRKCESGS